MSVSIRPYRPTDHSVCRALWAEFAETKRELYDEPDSGGDLGAGFEEHLTRLDLSGMWVAEHPEDGVIGLVGLILVGRTGEVNPVVVTQRHRSKGVGTALLDHIAAQAKRRGLKQLAVIPDSRNLAAIKTLHSAGFDVLASVRLTMELTGTVKDTNDMDLHGMQFRF